MLLKPLPFADAERLMLVHMLVPERARPGAFNESVWSYPKYRTFTASQQVFDEIAFFAGRDLDLSGDGEPQRVRGEVVTERAAIPRSSGARSASMRRRTPSSPCCREASAV